MKIVHVIDYFQPQLGYQEMFLAREHAALGHEVTVVTSERYSRSIYMAGDTVHRLGPRIRQAGFFIEEGINTWRLPVAFELPNIMWLRGLEKKLRELRPDLVIMHGISNFCAVRVARLKSERSSFKVIFDDHALPENSTGWMKMFYPLFRLCFAPGIMKKADALVAILPETKAFMVKRYGMPPDRIRVVPLGADTKLFRYDDKARREVRQELGFTEQDIVFIYTGKIIPMRQLDVLLSAAVRLTKRGRSIKLLFVGDGEAAYLESLQAIAREEGLDRVVTWYPAVARDRLYRHYAAADVAVWPYSASVGMREAMACNLPIIIGRESRVTELVEAENGLLFHEGDDNDLASRMEELLDSKRRKEMGRRSRRLVEDRFSWPSIARQFLDLVSS